MVYDEKLVRIMIHRLEQFAQHSAQEITEGEVEVIDILTRLVNLKAHKDKYGKDEIYIKEQPILWDKAKAILATLNK